MHPKTNILVRAGAEEAEREGEERAGAEEAERGGEEGAGAE